jgi:C4-dicarboxylate-specific signal transduction histidine kinase
MAPLLHQTASTRVRFVDNCWNPVNIHKRVGEVIDGLLLLMAERTRDTMTLDVPAELRPVRVVGDRIGLEQVLVNLGWEPIQVVDEMV